jgi:transketolase
MATNVKIIGVSGGVAYGALGSTHHSLHDIAALRAIPGIQIIIPSDPRQTAAMTKALARTRGAAYVRMGRGDVPDVYAPNEKDSSVFTLGKGNLLASGGDVAIITCGEMVYPAMRALELLGDEKISATVIDMHTVKPIDRSLVLEAAHRCGCIVAVEEHSVNGGLGGAIAEVTSREAPVPVRIMGIPDEPAVTGSQREVFEHYGLSAEGIAEQAMQVMKKRDGGY